MRKSLFVALAVSYFSGIAVAQTPQDRLVRSRAVEAVIWGMPAVNYDLMLQEMLTKTPGKVNQVIYWGKPLDWKNQTLTPNPDTLYFMTFLNTKDVGPIVIEIPPADANGSLNANIVNVWQQPLEDGGLLGVDKGAGVKLLMLPPGYKDQAPAGYEALQPNTWGSYALIRSNLKSHADADIVKSIAYAKQIKIYPLSQTSNPPATVFTDIKDVLFDSTIRYDESFFVNLDRMVQSEPWLGRDRAMIDQLRTIGIEKGKPFAPDAAMKQTLADSVREAHAWMAAKYDAAPPEFFEGTHWTFPTHPEMLKGASENFEGANDYPVDWRGITYHYAYIGIKRLGAGQFYLINIKDRDGADYDGAKTYRLDCRRSDPAVLVVDRVRPGHPCSDQERRSCQPGVEQSRSAEQCRWLGRPLSRLESACRSGAELDTDRSRPQVRADVPSLRTEEGVLRQGLEAAGRRKRLGPVNRTCQIGSAHDHRDKS
jgi:hypothetical protein